MKNPEIYVTMNPLQEKIISIAIRAVVRVN